MVSRAIVILNGHKPRRAATAARHLLEGLGVSVTLEITWTAEQGRACVERALARGVELVVVAGGDRTVRSVLEPVMSHGAVLAVLPLGAANDFAASVGIEHIKDGLLTLEEGVDVTLELDRGKRFEQARPLAMRVPAAYARAHRSSRVEARARHGGRPQLRLYSAASSAAWDE